MTALKKCFEIERFTIGKSENRRNTKMHRFNKRSYKKINEKHVKPGSFFGFLRTVQPISKFCQYFCFNFFP